MERQNTVQILVFLCQILNNHKVRYLVVGGAAVNAHGYYRPTTDRNGNTIDIPDFDFWFHPTILNYRKLLNAFENMGLDVVRYREEKHPFPKSSFFRFQREGYTLDFLPRIGGDLSFSDCYVRRAVSRIEETEVAVISLEDLILTKSSTGRKKDLEDIRVLKSLHKK